MKCGVCNKLIRISQQYVKCTQCDSVFHTNCLDNTESCPVCCEIQCLENVSE